jgi:hypothetical protein
MLANPFLLPLIPAIYQNRTQSCDKRIISGMKKGE